MLQLALILPDVAIAGRCKIGGLVLYIGLIMIQLLSTSKIHQKVTMLYGNSQS
jgi:hypothetical protein